MTCVPSNIEYQQSLYKTLPGGQIWPPFTADSTIRTLVDWIAYNVREEQLAACDMLDSTFPDSPDYVADWERVLDLPKESFEYLTFNVGDNDVGDSLGSVIVTSQLPSDIDIRVSQVLSFFANDGLNNAQSYIDMGAIFNVTVSSVVTPEPFVVTITISAGATDNITQYQALANFFKPAYCQLVFVVVP